MITKIVKLRLKTKKWSNFIWLPLRKFYRKFINLIPIIRCTKIIGSFGISS